MSKLQYHDNRTLKLTNVLKYRIILEKKDVDFDIIIRQMQIYIKTKGAIQVGPLIQYTKSIVNENGELNIEIIMMLQCNHYIHNVEFPYSMESIIRIPNALYCKYNGPEKYVKFAHDKIQLEAFENEIPLKGDSYTIFVDQNEEEETIIADVFMERADE